MISALIVDDEVININNLKALLNRHCKEIYVVATAQSADEARVHILNLKPEVVFLDIEMPIKSGFDLLKSIDNPNFDVVFVTAYDSYGIMAIKFSALDYLLKPINITELKITVDRIIQSAINKKQNSRLNNLLSLLDKNVDNEQKIALATLKETYFVPVKDIIRCTSSNNYTTFFLTNGEEYLISKPLYEYDEMLTPYGFIRCHQSNLVNKIHIKGILNEDSGYLVLNYTDHKIPISKQRKAFIKAMLGL